MPTASTVTALSALGTIARLPGVDDVQVLRPRKVAEASDRVYSGNFGYEEFPLHTDLAHWFLPPRHLAVRCVYGTDDVETRLLDGKMLIARISRNVLHSTLVQPRRSAGRRNAILRLLELFPPQELLRWDSIFIRPSTPRSQMICEAVREYVRSAAAIKVILREPGDTLIIDNWRMLHGRSRVPTGSVYRRIERIYLGDL